MSRPRILILDYKMSNLRSAAKALERLGASVTVTDAPVSLDRFDAVVLPGVGAFDAGLEGLRALPGMAEALIERIAADRPTLAVC